MIGWPYEPTTLDLLLWGACALAFCAVVGAFWPRGRT
jgi:hypothetical protein